MKKRLCCILLPIWLLCLLLSGCGNAGDTLPDTLALADTDLSGVRSVQLHSGMTGEKILLTDPADLAPLLDAVQALSGTDPISSRGYYGWTYEFSFYDTVSPGENDIPLLCFALSENRIQGEDIYTMTWGIYETVHGVSYSALYTADPAVVQTLQALCAAHFPPLPDA